MLLLVFAICMTAMIVLGPLPRAIQEKDYSELFVDFVLIFGIWFSYFFLWDFLLNLIKRLIN